MAGSAKDLQKRKRVRKFLSTEKGRAGSDRAAAAACACSRGLVRVVRAELIAAGLHPPVTERKGRGGNPMYLAGASVRGGYVLDENGRTVRDVVYAARQRRKGKAST